MAKRFKPQLISVTAANPLLEQELRAVDVTGRWRALMSFSITGELHAAGVAEHTIAILYPDEFLMLEEGLLRSFQQRPVTKYDEHWWGYHSDAIDALDRLLSEPLRTAKEEKLNASFGNGAFDRLVDGLSASLGGANVEARGSMMILALWNVHWHMTNLTATNLPKQRVHARFAATFDWVLPHLAEAA